MSFDITQFTQNIGYMADILQDVCVIIGVGLVMSSIYQFHRYGIMRGSPMMSHQSSIAKPFLVLISGALLLCMPTTLQTLMLAVWSSSSPMQYNSDQSDYQPLVSGIIMLVRLVGVGAVMRGCVLLARANGEQSQHGTLGKSILHLIGGIICVNIVASCDLLCTILGVS